MVTATPRTAAACPGRRPPGANRGHRGRVDRRGPYLGTGRDERTPTGAHALRGAVATVTAVVSGVTLTTKPLIAFAPDRTAIGAPYRTSGGCSLSGGTRNSPPGCLVGSFSSFCSRSCPPKEGALYSDEDALLSCSLRRSCRRHGSDRCFFAHFIRVGLCQDHRLRLHDQRGVQLTGQPLLRHRLAERLLHHRRMRLPDVPGQRQLRALLHPGAWHPCDPAAPTACRPGEICACDTAGGPTGCAQAYCTSEKTERRWCMQPCDQASDCRDGYGCYQTGANGALAVP